MPTRPTCTFAVPDGPHYRALRGADLADRWTSNGVGNMKDLLSVTVALADYGRNRPKYWRVQSSAGVSIFEIPKVNPDKAIAEVTRYLSGLLAFCATAQHTPE